MESVRVFAHVNVEREEEGAEGREELPQSTAKNDPVHIQMCFPASTENRKFTSVRVKAKNIYLYLCAIYAKTSMTFFVLRKSFTVAQKYFLNKKNCLMP